MQNKTAWVEKYLLDRIRSGEFPPGSKIPSQHRLMSQCNCSRITVQRALKVLIADGLLRPCKGSGTFVISGGSRTKLNEVVVICRELQNRPFTDIIPDFLPVRYIDIKTATRKCETFFSPGQAVIWPVAQEQDVMLMQYLRSRGIAQLLVNRTFEKVDYVTLDSVAGISEGLRWLQGRAGDNIAFISHDIHFSRPYLTERIISFYEACAVTGAKLEPQHIFRRDFSDPEPVFAEIGAKLFAPASRPRGICVLHVDLAPKVVECAAAYDLRCGRDYFMLMTDACASLMETPGVGMMIQPKELFLQTVAEYLHSRCAGENAPFHRRIKTRLHLT